MLPSLFCCVEKISGGCLPFQKKKLPFYFWGTRSCNLQHLRDALEISKMCFYYDDVGRVSERVFGPNCWPSKFSPKMQGGLKAVYAKHHIYNICGTSARAQAGTPTKSGQFVAKRCRDDLRSFDTSSTAAP